MTIGSTPVASINLGIEDAIERHRRRTRGNHRNHDPGKSPEQTRDVESAVPPSKERSGKRKWQRKHGVLELNHVEREAKSCPESGHCKQGRYHFKGCRCYGASTEIYGSSASSTA